VRSPNFQPLIPFLTGTAIVTQRKRIGQTVRGLRAEMAIRRNTE
jgi:hypothetical protein